MLKTGKLDVPSAIENVENHSERIHRFSYNDYEKAIRGPHYDYLREVSKENAQVFMGRSRVLDIASGQGMLLEELRKIGVDALGVDNESNLVRSCHEKGLNVVEDDVFHFLSTTEFRFDAASCAHLIEHFPFDPFLDLVEGVNRVLVPGGIFVIRWPNSRSAMTQFHSFWKDPTHSRFYDGDFVCAVLKHYHFDILERHYDTVEPSITNEHSFAEPIPTSSPSERAVVSSWYRRVFGKLLRKAMNRPLRIDHLLHSLAQVEQRLQLLEQSAQPVNRVFDLPGDARVIAQRR